MKKNQGVTLVEVMVAVALLSVISAMIPIAVKVLNALKNQQQIVVVNSEVKNFLDQITRDVREAPDFKIPKPYDDTLTIAQWDTKRFGFMDYNMFNKDNFGTINYSVVPSPDGHGFCIRRVSEFPASSKTLRQETLFLKGIIADPAGYDLFSFPKDSTTGYEMLESVLVDLRFRYSFQKRTETPKQFTVHVSILSRRRSLLP